MSSRPFASLDAPFAIIPAVDVLARIGRGARALYAFLKKLARRHPVVFPSQETLAKKLGCTDRSIRTYLNLLRTAGLIQILPRGRRRPPEYRITPQERPKRTEASGETKPTKTGETKLKETVSDRKIFPPKGSTTRSKNYMDLITRGRARGAKRADEIPAAEAAARRAAAEEILAVRAQLCELGACAAIANPAAYRATLVKKDAQTLGGDLERNRAWLAQVRAERTPRLDAGAYAPPAETAAEAAWKTTPPAERKPWLRRAFARLRAAGMWAQVCEGFAHLADFKRFRREFLTRQAQELFCAEADAPAAETPGERPASEPPGPEAVTPHSAAGVSPAPPGRTWETTPSEQRKAWLRRTFESLRASGMWAEISEAFRQMENFGQWRREFLTQQARELFCAAGDAAQSAHSETMSAAAAHAGAETPTKDFFPAADRANPENHQSALQLEPPLIVHSQAIPQMMDPCGQSQFERYDCVQRRHLWELPDVQFASETDLTLGECGEAFQASDAAWSFERSPCSNEIL